MLIIESKNFVTSSHLVYEIGQYSWSSNCPEEALLAGNGIRSLAEMCKIFGNDCDSLIPDNYIRSAEVLNIEPPWSVYIGSDKFQDLINKQIGFYEDLTKDHDGRLIDFHSRINYFIDKKS